MKKILLAGLLLVTTATPLLQGCLPIVAAGATGGALATVDRRTLGTQTEDEAIEWKATSRLSEKFGDKVHANFTSFNRKVLISGEAFNEQMREDVGRMVAAIPQVLGVHNELAIAPISSLSARTNDSYITTKVKSRLLDSKSLKAVHVKVVTEAGIVYLLGIVTQSEAESAIRVARTTSDVRKVVSLLEIVADTRARELDSRLPESNAPANQPIRSDG